MEEKVTLYSWPDRRVVFEGPFWMTREWLLALLCNRRFFRTWQEDGYYFYDLDQVYFSSKKLV